MVGQLGRTSVTSQQSKKIYDFGALFVYERLIHPSIGALVALGYEAPYKEGL